MTEETQTEALTNPVPPEDSLQSNSDEPVQAAVLAPVDPEPSEDEDA